VPITACSNLTCQARSVTRQIERRTSIGSIYWLAWSRTLNDQYQTLRQSCNAVVSIDVRTVGPVGPINWSRKWHKGCSMTATLLDCRLNKPECFTYTAALMSVSSRLAYRSYKIAPIGGAGTGPLTCCLGVELARTFVENVLQSVCVCDRPVCLRPYSLVSCLKSIKYVAGPVFRGFLLHEY
jgi:hypothetical protein